MLQINEKWDKFTLLIDFLFFLTGKRLFRGVHEESTLLWFCIFSTDYFVLRRNSPTPIRPGINLYLLRGVGKQEALYLYYVCGYTQF